MICDIRKAFLNIGVAKTNQDALRFLWVDDPFKADPSIVSYRFTRVMFGLNCSPFLLNGTLRHHLMKFSSQHEEMIPLILRSLYVDDFTGGAEDVEKSIELYRLLIQVLEVGGFPVHKFVTNNTELQTIINSDSGTEPKIEVKVLGSPWNTESDTISIALGVEIESGGTLTKRVIASVLMRIFDPLGLVTPIVMPIKLMLQKAWVLNLDWDTSLSDEIADCWQAWCESLKKTSEFRIPRCYITETPVNCKLIGFCDASTKAFAAVVYL